MEYDFTKRLRWLLHLIADEKAIEMDEYLEPEFDFSAMSPGKSKDITNDEIIEVYKRHRTCEFPLPVIPPDWPTYGLIGFSRKGRCLIIMMDYPNDKLRFLNARIANEHEIENHWCGRRRIGRTR